MASFRVQIRKLLAKTGLTLWKKGASSVGKDDLFLRLDEPASDLFFHAPQLLYCLVNTYLLLAALESAKTFSFRPEPNLTLTLRRKCSSGVPNLGCCPGLSYVGIACLDLSLRFCFRERKRKPLDLTLKRKSGASVPWAYHRKLIQLCMSSTALI